ncbi:hypothetical protein GGX14DRAFT_675828 [Mycena pura]|uniref:Uncharacterized protein n=1 Tax=Mycena pura TaxID=153505 RepID=A0AAD6VV60_9AGAR|nr:hypothetical protein GGX14DRAFT_675828 [Mycena pura]
MSQVRNESPACSSHSSRPSRRFLFPPISLQASIALPSEGFPAAWLLPYDDQVIVKAQWNHEAPPADAPDGDEFTADWSISNSAVFFTPTSLGVAIGPTIVRHYFGLAGCIIPIASIEPMLSESPAMIFTIAGPADAEGKKQFYVYFHDSLDLSATEVYSLSRFASVADFFRNPHAEQWGHWQVRVPPVPGGEDMAKQELNKLGYSYDVPAMP